MTHCCNHHSLKIICLIRVECYQRAGSQHPLSQPSQLKHNLPHLSTVLSVSWQPTPTVTTITALTQSASSEYSAISQLAANTHCHNYHSLNTICLVWVQCYQWAASQHPLSQLTQLKHNLPHLSTVLSVSWQPTPTVATITALTQSASSLYSAISELAANTHCHS